MAVSKQSVVGAGAVRVEVPLSPCSISPRLLSLSVIVYVTVVVSLTSTNTSCVVNTTIVEVVGSGSYGTHVVIVVVIQLSQKFISSRRCLCLKSKKSV